MQVNDHSSVLETGKEKQDQKSNKPPKRKERKKERNEKERREGTIFIPYISHTHETAQQHYLQNTHSQKQRPLEVENPTLHLHWYDPAVLVHVLLSMVAHGLGVWLHSLVSVLQFAPSHPVLHVQLPLTASHDCVLVGLHVQALVQPCPY